MTLKRSAAGLIVLLASCDPAAREPGPGEPPKELPAVAATPDPPEVVELADPLAPASSFDPATATAATVRIITIHSESTGPCGILHSTGAIEVEVGSASRRRG